MSFIKNYFFGSSSVKKDTTNNNDKDKSKQSLSDLNESTKNKTDDDYHTNFSKCKILPTGYIESKMSNLRIDHISLFDGNTLLVDKLYQMFVEDVEKFKLTKFDEKDIFRPDVCNSKGGVELKSKELTSLIRSSGTEIIKQIGKKLLSGDFNLTTISFPIKVMIPYTILQSVSRSKFQFPYYMQQAIGKDSVEKLKLLITASISTFYCSCWFLKPLNPVLGETYEAMFSDGSKIYVEQTSHHPPISSFEIYGPNKSWYYYGNSHFGSSAGLNSLTIYNKGKRGMKFSDGTEFKFDFCREYYSNTFWGTIRQESLGDITFTSTKEDLNCKVKIGALKGKPSDSLSGEIIYNGKVVSTLSGSYMSHINFDDVRYWDIRENFPIKFIELDKNLPSSSLYREDRILLEKEMLVEGQEVKEKIENLQRADRKLREKYGVKHK